MLHVAANSADENCSARSSLYSPETDSTECPAECIGLLGLPE
jgi:hypothetical protein